MSGLLVLSLVMSSIICLALLARCLWLNRQVEALVASKVLEGQQIQHVPAWQISGKTASRILGLVFFVATFLLALGVQWFVGPLDADTLRYVKIIVGIVGTIVAAILLFIAFIGFFGGMD